MIVVKAGLKDVIDIDLPAVAAVDLQANDLAGGGFVANSRRNLQLAYKPAELLVVGTRVTHLDGSPFGDIRWRRGPALITRRQDPPLCRSRSGRGHQQAYA